MEKKKKEEEKITYQCNQNFLSNFFFRITVTDILKLLLQSSFNMAELPLCHGMLIGIARGIWIFYFTTLLFKISQILMLYIKIFKGFLKAAGSVSFLQLQNTALD